MSGRRARLTTPPLSTTPLTPETLKQLLDTFDRAMSHTHYAVCGHAALMVWGYRGNNMRHAASHVSIVCPADARQVILTWARTAGWHVYPSCSPGDHADVIGVPLPGSNGELAVWGFRLRAVGDGEVWERLQRVRPCQMEMPYLGWVGEMIRTEAQVMAVPTLLDEFVRAWYFCGVKGVDEGGDERERYVADLILWILRRLADDGEKYGARARWKLTPQNVPCLLYGKFRDAFLRRYPEALDLMQKGGLQDPKHPAISEVTTSTQNAPRVTSDDSSTGLCRISLHHGAHREGNSRSEGDLRHPQPSQTREYQHWI
jgi:hypothetical protein